MVELADDDEKGDATPKNLEGGDETIGLAARWLAPDEWGLKELQRMQGYLPGSVKVCLEIIELSIIDYLPGRDAASSLKRKPDTIGVEPGDG